jgi:uncharacterized RDD family membrane protein YckC
MLCVRCAHPLAPRADRCLRCFALNPQNRTEPIAPETRAKETPRPAPLEPPGPSLDAPPPLGDGDFRGLSIDSSPPRGGLDVGALAIDSAPPDAAPRVGALSFAWDSPILLPGVRLDFPAALPPLALPEPVLLAPDPQQRLTDAPSLPPAPEHPLRPGARRQLLAWSLDGLVLASCVGLFALLAILTLGAARLAPAGGQSAHSWADLLVAGRSLKLAWVALAGALALAYSWLFGALGGRTPGMALTGLKLEREDGSPLSPGRALARALLSLPSAAVGLFGFWLALVDPRGQTLHDKLTHSVIVRAVRAG